MAGSPHRAAMQSARLTVARPAAEHRRMSDPASDTPRRILAAAAHLFYSEGIAGASMDAIAAQAGLTKRSLYYHFRSKDDLVAAWLEGLDGEVRARYRAWLGSAGPIEARLRHMFARLADHARDPRWKGCGFARAACELAGMPGHPGVRAAQAHRKRFEAWFAEELRQAGVEPAEALGRRLIVLLDGAIVQAMLHHDPAYVEQAGIAAADLVAGARRGAARPAA